MNQIISSNFKPRAAGRLKELNGNGNLRKMHNAISLNGCITTESHSADLVVLNLPPTPNTPDPVR